MPKVKDQFTAFYQGKKAVRFDFSGEAVSSNGGFLLLSKIERKHRIIRDFSSLLPDLRDPSRTVHSYEKQLRQRIFSMACGYEDCNDAQYLKEDPVLQVAIGGDLCSQPTLCRMENTINRATVWQLCHWWADRYVSNLAPGRKEIVIDIDSTDDPTHGGQQLSMFHAYTWQFQYDQLFLIDGTTGEVILPVLRPGNSHTARWAVPILSVVIDKIRSRFPEMRIVVRADSGYSSAAFYRLVAEKKLFFCLGLAANAVLKREIEDLKRQITEKYVKRQQKHQHITEAFSYRAQTWDTAYPTYAKVESTGKGLNTRFFISNLEHLSGEEIYFDFYVQRGETCENRIKEIKNMCFSDRLSCHGFWANFFRLFLSAIVYELFRRIKELIGKSKEEEAKRWQVETLRLFLLKVGASVTKMVRSVRIRYSSAFARQHLFRELMGMC